MPGIPREKKARMVTKLLPTRPRHHAHGPRAQSARDLTAPGFELLCRRMIHTLERTQFIPASSERVWAYFSTPENLNALTPPDMDFEILGAPGRMYAGQIIAYRIRVAPGLRVRWLTEIRHVREGEFFVDEQRAGPYRLWYHEHHFAPVAGGVQMTDRVTYALRFGPLGDLIHLVWVGRTLRRIFDYRRVAVARLFAPGG